MVSEVVGAERAELILLAQRLRMRLAGVAAFDPIAAADLRSELVEMLADGVSSRKAAPGSRSEPAMPPQAPEADVEGLILAMLGEADRPMSLEQIFDMVQEATSVDIKRETLAVRLHRMAKPPHNKIVNTSRGHYWAREEGRG